jgi:hypothetical protein
MAETEVVVPAVISQGRGALTAEDLPFGVVYVANSQACSGLLPRGAGAAEVVVVQRGGCTFADKISNIPDSVMVKLVIVEDYHNDSTEEGTDGMQAPVIDGVQLNAWGRSRNNKVGLVMVRGGVVEWRRVKSVAVRTRVGVRVQGRDVGGLDIT